MKLKKDLKVIDIWSLALGSIIGFGCFVLPGTSFLPQAGPIGTVIGLTLGGLIVSIIGINYGYLIEKYPKAGGEFVYARNNFGPLTSFACGWFLILAYISIVPLNATAVALVSRYVLGDVFQVGYMYTVAGWDVYMSEVIIALVFLVAFAYFNIIGIKQSGKIQTGIVIILVLTIIALTAGMFLWVSPAPENLTPSFPSGTSSVTSVLAILAMTPWAFSGFDCIPQATEEFDFPKKKAKWLLFSSIAFAILMYSAITLVTAAPMSWEGFIASAPDWATGEAVMATMGTPGMTMLVVAMLCAVVSGMNGFYISASRLIYSMANDNYLPKGLGKVSKKHSTPHNAILFVLIVSLVTPFFGREVLGWVVDMCSVGMSVAYMITSLAAYKQGKIENKSLYVFTGILGAVVSLGFLILLLVPGMPGFLSVPSLVALAVWVAVGVVFYLIRKK